MSAKPIVPDVAELASTVSRMERRYGGQESPHVAELMTAYRRLAGRFEGDLADERDVLLCKSAALMMVRYMVDPPER